MRDERVLVPLDTLTLEEGRRTARMLAGQAPGRPGAPPAAPLQLDLDGGSCCATSRRRA